MAYINISSEVISPKCFRNNQTVTNVDLSNVPFTNATMYRAFRDCGNLKSVTNIPEGTTNIIGAFRNCTNLTNIGKLPDSVTCLAAPMPFGNLFGYDTTASATDDYVQSLCLTEEPSLSSDVIIKATQGFFQYATWYKIVTITDNGFTYNDGRNVYTATRNTSRDQYVPYDSDEYESAFRGCNSLSVIPEFGNRITNLDYAFRKLPNIRTVTNLPDTILTMTNTFNGCKNLVSVIIPNNVKSLTNTFSGSGIVNPPNIPNTVTNMDHTFWLSSLKTCPQIPNSVKYMEGTFSNTNIVESAHLPDSIVSANGIYWNTNINKVYNFPRKIEDISSMFGYCRQMNCTIPEIPESVTNIYGTFSNCLSLSQDIKILSEGVVNATDCFYGTSLSKNVYIPFTYSNGVNTITYNTFTNAGYDTNGTTNGVYLKDIETYFKLYFVGDVTQWEFTNDYLLTYQGNKTFSISDVIVPANSYFLVSTNDWEHGYRTSTGTILSTGDSEFTDTINGTDAFKTGDNAVVIGELRLNRKTGYLQFLNVINYTEPTTKVNVENFNYTAKAGKVTLTRYTGSQSNVVLPELEDK